VGRGQTAGDGDSLQNAANADGNLLRLGVAKGKQPLRLLPDNFLYWGKLVNIQRSRQVKGGHQMGGEKHPKGGLTGLRRVQVALGHPGQIFCGLRQVIFLNGIKESAAYVAAVGVGHTLPPSIVSKKWKKLQKTLAETEIRTGSIIAHSTIFSTIVEN
jgi:hypothetical protein